MMSIILYGISHLIYFLHQRNQSLNARASIKNGAALAPESVNEEEQEMANYLRNQENK